MQNGQQAMGYGLNAGVGGTQIGAGGTGNSTVLFPHQVFKLLLIFHLKLLKTNF